ncbi:MAG: hypothetical protein ACI9WH_000842, partial [Glaciecola sp.]
MQFVKTSPIYRFCLIYIVIKLLIFSSLSYCISHL